MSQLVDTGNGVAEFPDGMTHDDIADVIKKQFYSPQNPPPKEQRPSGFSAIGLGSSDFAMPGQMAEGFDPIEAAKSQTSPESLAPIPQIPQQEGVLKQTGAAIVNTATGAVNFATSPAGLQTLPAAFASAPLGRIMAAAFAPEMITEGVKGAIKEPTLQGKLQGALGALLGIGGAVHGAGLLKKLAPVTGKAEVLSVEPYESNVSYKTEHKVTVRNHDGSISELRPAEHYGISLSESRVSPVPEAGQAPVESSVALPENTEVTIKATTPKGDPLEVKMDAREAEKVLTDRKTALEKLIDCLGA